jgi:hypothetical protein
MSGFSDERKKTILEEFLIDGWLALTTVAVKGSDTGATIVEPTYTGYARIEQKKTQWSAAAENKRHNNVLKSFPECTAGTSNVIGWALCTSSETGKGLIVCSGVIPLTVVAAGIIPEFNVGSLVFGMSDT